MLKLYDMEEKIQVDGKIYTAQQLVYAVRMYERVNLGKREAMKKRRQKDKGK